MVDQGEYSSGSWDPFFSSTPVENCFSHNLGRDQPFMRPANSTPSFHGTPFLNKTSSASSLNTMSSPVAQQPMAFPRTNSGSSLNMSSGPMPNALSRSSSVGNNNSLNSLHDMAFMNMAMTNSASSMHGNHGNGMAYLPRRSSASALHGMASGMSSEPSQNGLQKISFLIPQPPGPPTLVHVFTSASPNSHAPNTVFGGGNFSMTSPQPMSPMFTPPTMYTPQEAIAANIARKSWLLDEVSRKVLHQVEFYFSDLNVATTDHLIRYMKKDPKGYVPISVIASFKKIKTAISSNAQLADILRHSERLIVSDDGKRVKRVDHLTDSYMEELQSRIVVAENLPEDHCHQTLMIIFSEVGSVKAIRTCPPSVSYGVVSSTPKTETSDGLFHSNKLHAFVEYESPDMAEKAVAELNDVEANGLKVHFLKPKAKSSPPKSQKACRFSDISGLSTDESEGEEDGEQKKQQGKGRVMGRERLLPPPLNSRTRMMGTSFSSPNLSLLSNHEPQGPIRQPRVPRMPDGTRGFSMGRGKMIAPRPFRL